MNTKTASVIIGLAFIAVGCLGFISNPIVGEAPNVIFHADSFHNAVHITSGLLFLLFGIALPAHAGTFCKVFGIIYFLLGLLGLINIGTNGMGKLLGILHVNGADNFLHMGLGLIIFIAGTLNPAPSVRRN